MRKTLLVWPAILIGSSALAGQEVITLHPDRIEGTINPMIYGQFLEHIYDSVVDGLDGQLLRGPSFEEAASNLPHGWELINGAFHIEGKNGELVSEKAGPDCHVLTGDPEWADYEVSVEAKKEGGNEGFLILFRATDKDNFYWWNLGGWGNTSSAVEHEVDGARSKVAGTDRPITIETGRWYDIRVACKGKRIECFLDGQKVCDFEDETNGHGRIGLGTWVTEARYRGLKALSKQVDLMPQPAAREAVSLSQAWSPLPGNIGVRCEWTSENPLNSRHCQMLATGQEGGGIFQNGIPLAKGRTYEGSLWARGAGALSVSLKAGDHANKVSSKVSSTDWTEIPFSFTPEEDTEEGRFSIQLDDPGEIYLDQCTLRLAHTPYRPGIFEKVAELRPAFIRWPGGCYAEYYRFLDGVGPLKDRVSKPNLIWGGIDPNYFGTDEYVRLCRDVKAEPLIVLNIGHHDPPEKVQDYIEEALNWVEYCNGDSQTKFGAMRAANGHPEPYHVRYWEIGNETWVMGVAQYAERVKLFVDALRAKDPSLKFLVCGSGGHNQDWNRDILRLAATHMDYLSVHQYMEGTFENEMRDGVEYPKFLAETGKLIKESANPEVKIAVTEWNQQSVSLRTGLYAGLVLNGFERYSDSIAMSCPALFIRKVIHKEWNNALINHNSDRVFVAPNFLVMKLYHDHFAPIRVGVDAPAGLDVLATKDGTTAALILKVVNPSASEEVACRVEVENGPKVKGMQQWRVCSGGIDDKNSLENPDKIRIEQAPLIGPEVTFPAHSITILRFKG